jgi:HK97 family phage prohead protease
MSIGKPTSLIERRAFAPDLCKLEFRAKTADAPSMIRGYAAVYGKRSENLGSSDNPFFEVIEPGFFDDVMNDDVRALFNHDENHVLARSRNGKGTLRLFNDEIGLGYEFEPPATSTGDDLQESMRRGDIAESSFAFSIKPNGDKWVEENGITTRTLKKGGAARLYDVSPVTYPAYPDTAVAMCSLSEFRKATAAPVVVPEKPSQPPLDLWEKRLASINR